MVATLIVNPVSGGGRAQAHLDRVVAAIEARFGTPDVRMTQCRGDGRNLARASADAGSDFIVAMGGDGTISECVDGILSSAHPRTPLAIVPAGTGSDFARSLRPASRPAAWVDRFTFPQFTPIDAGRLTLGGSDPLHFVNIASFGISGIIAEKVNNGWRPPLLPSRMVFLLRSLAEIVSFRPVRVAFSVDGGAEREGEIALVAVANGPVFGGGMKVAPAAIGNDGLFEIVIVDGLSPMRLLAEFPWIYLGRHVRHRGVEVIRARSLGVQLLSGQGAIEVDGETAGQLPARFEIMPGALNLAMELK